MAIQNQPALGHHVQHQLALVGLHVHGLMGPPFVKPSVVVQVNRKRALVGVPLGQKPVCLGI